MKLLSERPYWPIKDGIPGSFPRLERDESCDVAVIGGGISGALVAWRLVEAGHDVVVLDRREVAHGSTAGSTSLLQYELDVPLHRLAGRIGPEAAARCYRRLRAAIAEVGKLARGLGIECGFEAKRSLYLASTAREVAGLQREYVARAAAGFDVAWWGRKRVAAESSLPHRAAILSGGAAQVDPYRLAYGLLEAARGKGARVYGRSKVTEMLRREGVRSSRSRRAASRAFPEAAGYRRVAISRAINWSGPPPDSAFELRTEQGSVVRARRVVMANGYEGEGLDPCALTELHSTFAFASEPVAEVVGWPEGRPVIWETRRPYCYLRTTEDGRVIMGGLDEPFRDPTRRDRLVGRKVASLRRIYARWFPESKIEIATGWAGTFAETTDGLPLIGARPGKPNVWLALGYGANGIPFSEIGAEMIVEGMKGKSVRDEDIFGIGRCERGRCGGR